MQFVLERSITEMKKKVQNSPKMIRGLILGPFMLPGIDMANHNSITHNSVISIEDNNFVLKSIMKIPAGEGSESSFEIS